MYRYLYLSIRIYIYRFILFTLQFHKTFLLKLLLQLRKRTIERKNSREGILNSISLTKKNEANSNGQNDNKGEFDDLISALRTGDVFGEDIAKFKRSKRRPVTPSGQETRRHSTHKEDSRERH